ncbi:hypothetical protein SBOR_9699 [Sclerotinia borealis F-4128]|uniref:DDE-1 domain-containing protein n=1 Tax=Sclerotinia borealis (strain F-4128) TaxID=1432307 RepID=W9C5T7_SCLBF|nr:hypothetical protein SBOR_9699 [Sclerotinia borealis F-4128]
MSSQLSQLSLKQIHHDTQVTNQCKYPGRSRTRHPLPSEPEKGQITLLDSPPLIDGQRRHWVDGINEQALVKAFHHFRNQEGDFETGTFTYSFYPQQLQQVIQRWYQFNRRNTIQNDDSDAGNPLNESINNPRIERFLLSNIANMDQTPLAFEFGSTGRTYDHKGNNTVFLKGSKSGWEKRQATLQILVSADGIPRCKPLIMFRGVEGYGNKTRQRELKKYHKGVDIIFNPKGYCNAKELLKWFKTQYKWSTMESPAENEPHLLTLDFFAAHKGQGCKIKVKESASERQIREKSTLDVILLRQILKDFNVITSIIPRGTTGYVQMFDISVNKTIKDLIRNLEEEHYNDNLEQ